MLVKRVLSLPALPSAYVVERMDGTYAAFAVTPYRKIQETELMPLCSNVALMACHGLDVPAYELPFYGLTICNGKD